MKLKEPVENEEADNFWSSGSNKRNLLIFIMTGITCNFGYYMINFYAKYMPGSIFIIQVASSLAESVANGSAHFVSKRLDAKKGFICCFILTCIAAILLLFANTFKPLKALVPFFVLVAKGGVTMAFCFVYFAPLQFYDSKYMGLVMGGINFFARISTIAAPMVAEVGGSVPMATLITLATLAVVSSTCLNK